MYGGPNSPILNTPTQNLILIQRTSFYINLLIYFSVSDVRHIVFQIKMSFSEIISMIKIKSGWRNISEQWRTFLDIIIIIIVTI